MSKCGVSADCCANCGIETGLSSCGRCKLVKYCGKECQTQHWKSDHKQQCVKLEDRRPHPLPPQEGERCSICFETLTRQTRHLLPCFHVFHYDCTEKALKETKGTCPLCRSNIVDGVNKRKESMFETYAMAKRLHEFKKKPFEHEVFYSVCKRSIPHTVAVRILQAVYDMPLNDAFIKTAKERCAECQTFFEAIAV